MPIELPKPTRTPPPAPTAPGNWFATPPPSGVKSSPTPSWPGSSPGNTWRGTQREERHPKRPLMNRPKSDNVDLRAALDGLIDVTFEAVHGNARHASRLVADTIDE